MAFGTNSSHDVKFAKCEICGSTYPTSGITDFMFDSPYSLFPSKLTVLILIKCHSVAFHLGLYFPATFHLGLRFSVTFHQGLHCLPKYPFRGFQYTVYYGL